MSTVAGFVVTLDADLDTETAERAIELLRSIRGVVAVQPIDGDPVVGVMTEQRVLARCRTAMLNAVNAMK